MITVRKHFECGTRSRYQRGCGCSGCVAAGDTAPHRACAACKAANREYERDRRRGAAAGTPPAAAPVAVEPEKPATTEPLKTVTAGVTSVLGRHTTGRPDLVNQALALAALIDDPLTPAGSRVTASRELRSVMDKIDTLVSLGARPSQPEAKAEDEKPAATVSPIVQLRSRRGA